MADTELNTSEMITIATSKLSAVINPYGAELTHLRDAEGRELMTDADPAFWTGHAPILFPVIGVTNGGVIRLDGVEYPMPKHGFARHSTFELVAQEKARAVFRLTDDAETRKSYPFAFVLEISFTITGAALEIAARIENPGDVALPASFGFHPAFAWPLPYGEKRENHRIVFDQHEPATLKEILPDGLIGPEERASPLDGRRLILRDSLFTDDALVWDTVKSSHVTYGAADAPVLRIAFPETPKLGIWTKPGSAYICVEPWHGIADYAGFTGNFRDKPGVFEVAPRGDWHTALTIELLQ